MGRRPVQGPCRVIGCGRQVDAKGMCGKHYRMQWRHGRTELVNTGEKRSHPLYSIWFERKSRGSLCEAWAENFWAFVEAVGSRPSPTHLLRRIRRSKPYEEGNWCWMNALKRQPSESKEAFGARKWKDKIERHPDHERRRHLKRKFGLTPEDYDARLKAQGGVCAICKEVEAFGVRKNAKEPVSLSVDHCHTTGKLRALLCFRCNSTLGKVNDSPDLLRSMVAYLAEWA